MTLVRIAGRAVPWSGKPAARAAESPVRVRPAAIADMERVEPLINAFARRGRMLPKTREQLYRTFREFLVAEDEDGDLLGCVALRVYTPEVAEVSALAVSERAHGRGVGRLLMERLTAEAKSLEMETLFALTLEPRFFRRFGYERVDRSQFPLKIASDCAGCPRRDDCPEITVARRLTGDDLSNEDGG